jgi:hypothetical protein
MRLAIPLVLLGALGIVVIVASGWGALWLYGLLVVTALVFVVFITVGGSAIQNASRGRFRD